MNARYYAGISSGFGNRVLAGKRGFHGGIDFRVPAGTAVLSTADGKVTRTGHLDNNCGYGVKIQHDGPYATIVCHLSKVTVVRGQRVRRGDELGKSGGVPGTKGSGKSTGPHIHYAIKHNGKLIDPTNFVGRPQPKTVKRPKILPCRVPAAHDKRAILNYVECRGTRAGLPAGYMAVMAIAESTVDPKAHNEGSGAAGLYQFKPATAAEYNLKNPYDIAESTTAAIKYAKTFTRSQDAVTLYMQHNQGVCGYSIIVDMAALGKANMVCGGKTHSNAKIFKHIRGNVNGRYKRIVRNEGELNRKSASAYINFMKKVYWPKGVRQWKKITSSY